MLRHRSRLARGVERELFAPLFKRVDLAVGDVVKHHAHRRRVHGIAHLEINFKIYNHTTIQIGRAHV